MLLFVLFFLSKLQTIKTLLAFISSQIIFDGDHLAKEQKILSFMVSFTIIIRLGRLQS